MGCKDTQACENQKRQNFEKATRSTLKNKSKNSQCRPKSQKSKRFHNYRSYLKLLIIKFEMKIF